MNELPLLNTSEFLCARCARHMRTCCQTREIYCTPGDVRRIGEHTGRDDHFAFRVPDDPDYLDQDDDPTWRDYVFRDDDARRVLHRRDDGDCTFLGDRGCVLPLDVRPLVCRIYPYDYTEAGIRDELADGCPLELLQPGQTLIEALDMDRHQAVEWHRQLYAEIRMERDEP